MRSYANYIWLIVSETLKVHHCLSMVTIWLPLATIDLMGDNREFEV